MSGTDGAYDGTRRLDRDGVSSALFGRMLSAIFRPDKAYDATSLHIFFGAYPNMMNLFAELNIHDRYLPLHFFHHFRY